MSGTEHDLGDDAALTTHTITFDVTQVLDLIAHARRSGGTVSLAKDSGAYLVLHAERSQDNQVVYADGFAPAPSEDAADLLDRHSRWMQARLHLEEHFGGDDFGFPVDLDALEREARAGTVTVTTEIASATFPEHHDLTGQPLTVHQLIAITVPV